MDIAQKWALDKLVIDADQKIAAAVEPEVVAEVDSVGGERFGVARLLYWDAFKVASYTVGSDLSDVICSLKTCWIKNIYTIVCSTFRSPVFRQIYQVSR